MDSTLSLSTWSGARKTLVLTLLVIILLPFLYASLPHGLDWHDTYRPAALAVLHGQSPYTVEIYYAAPWAAWLLIPIAVLPTPLGQMMIFLSGVAAYTYIAWRLGATPVSLILFLSSAAVIGCLINGNIEWLPLLGAVLPPQIGLILLAVKPQVGLGLGLYWLITIWRQRGFREVVITFAPVGVLLLLSFLLYGLWPIALFTNGRLEQRQCDPIPVWNWNRAGPSRPSAPDPGLRGGTGQRSTVLAVCHPLHMGVPARVFPAKTKTPTRGGHRPVDPDRVEDLLRVSPLRPYLSGVH